MLSLFRKLAGYYRGLLEDVDAVKVYFRDAKKFIEKVSP